MTLEFVVCPICKQKLGIYNYMTVGTDVVCANCETNLRVEQHNPIKVKQIPISQTLNANSRPESYG